MTDDDRGHKSVDGPTQLRVNGIQRKERTEAVEPWHIIGPEQVDLQENIERARQQGHWPDEKKYRTEKDAEILTNKPPGFPEDPPEASHTLKS
jgi:hypothetical protein